MVIRYLVSVTQVLKDTQFGLDNMSVEIYYYYSVLLSWKNSTFLFLSSIEENES
jgi:hypothetical protein